MIEHEGTIVDVYNGKARVRIINNSACASCQLGGKCNLSETKEKLIDVHTRGIDYHKGEVVTIVGAESLGMKALFLGYILPFLLLLTVVVLLTINDFSELTAGISGIAILVPYYLSLLLFREKLKKQFSFYLKNR